MFLPDWLFAYAHYTEPCRQQACRSYAESRSAEQAVLVKDPARVLDPSTVLGWVRRRIVSGWLCLALKITTDWQVPTLIAWDQGWFTRTLDRGGSGRSRGPPFDQGLEARIGLLDYYSSPWQQPLMSAIGKSRTGASGAVQGDRPTSIVK